MADRAEVVVLVGVLLAVTGTGCSTPADAEQASASGWRQLPDAPVGPRDDAVLVGLGDRVLVVGGWRFSCPPNADCSAPQDPLFRDGAVYDATTDAWSSIAPPPFGLRRGEGDTAALDGTAYLVTGCADGPACEAPPRLLSYRPDDDRWSDHGVIPGVQPVPRRVTTLDGSLLVYSTGDTLVPAADLLFDPGTAAWTELPDDPLPWSYDRYIVPVGRQLVLAGSPSPVLPPSAEPADMADRFDRKLAARFDLDRAEWVVLPDAPGQGRQMWPTDRGPLLHGYESGSPAWILDPGTWSWTALPAHTGGSANIHGVLDAGRAVYAGAPLRVYDSRTNAYVSVPDPPGGADVYGSSSAALGRRLVIFGGHRTPTSSSGGASGAVDDVWSWTPPPG
ncbi:hypothetical protein SAMN05660662_2230 [Blastococcus aurantiacus]|uniref:Galactose oxidase n=1 Tax=Blastococcus aurantiacus TaxID=1550231 RepID=A0A1G7LDE9_9ACTN|nr:hypothetical protein [Blastococcus aurantiacus]SDF46989.1 hypothetical protein SAMN05660662_2230 [Blastococcus aurantiacus]